MGRGDETRSSLLSVFLPSMGFTVTSNLYLLILHMHLRVGYLGQFYILRRLVKHRF